LPISVGNSEQILFMI